MMKRSPSEAVAPAFGLRVMPRPGATEKHDKVLVQAADHGGRGCPHLGIIVPIEETPTGFAVRGLNGPLSWRNLKRAGACVNRIRERASPYQVSVPRARWPSGDLLFLFLYLQGRGIGQTIQTFAIDGDSPRSIFDQIAQSVGRCLENRSSAELMGGLIRSSPADGSREPAGVTFAVASCQFPSDIFDHMPDDLEAARGPADASLLALGDLLAQPDGPTLVLLAGDQVYVDSTAGLFDPKVLDDTFRIPYERLGASRGAKAVLQHTNVRVETMMDDHEVHDNWAPNDPAHRDPDTGLTPIQAGKQAYFTYQRLLKGRSRGHLWHSFEHDGVPFFIGDSRTEREGRTARNWDQARIMSTRQFRALTRWMDKWAALPKFVLTPSALLPRSLAVACDPASALHADAWDGHPHSLHKLLRFVCDNEIKGLVFLSGDEHISNVVCANVTNLETGEHCIIHSVHSSALYAPYPFANATKDDFAAHDTFRFPDPKNGPYECIARTRFPDEGDGFAVCKVRQSASAWRLEVTFHGANGPKPCGPLNITLI